VPGTGHQDIVCRLGCGGDRGGLGSLAELGVSRVLGLDAVDRIVHGHGNHRERPERRGGEFAPLASWEWTIQSTMTWFADLGSAFLLVELTRWRSFLGSSASDSSAPHPASSAPPTIETMRIDQLLGSFFTVFMMPPVCPEVSGLDWNRARGRWAAQ